MHQGRTDASCCEQIIPAINLASETMHSLIRRGVAIADWIPAECERIVCRRYSGGGEGRWRKNTTLPFENVTPLEG